MSVEIRGLDKLIKTLGKVAAIATIRPAMERSVRRVQRRMQEYPPALPPRQGPVTARTTRRGRAVFRQGYRRTGTYGRRWTVRITQAQGGLEGRVGNNVAYGPYVGSHRFQARIHRGRWNTDQRVVEQEAPAILADFQRTIDRALAE